MNLLHLTRVSANVSSDTSRFMEALLLGGSMRKLAEDQKIKKAAEDFPAGHKFKLSTLTPTGNYKVIEGTGRAYILVEVICNHYGIGEPSTKFVRAKALKAGKLKSCGCALARTLGNLAEAKNKVPLLEALKASFFYCPNTGNFYKRLSSGNLSSRAAGCTQSGRYLAIRFRDRLWLNHRLAWLYHYGVEPTDHIDHIDGDGCNNRIENLRECLPFENGQNRNSLNRNNTSGFAGVCETPYGWSAEIMLHRKKHSLGLYPTAVAANAAREEAKLKLHTFSPTTKT